MLDADEGINRMVRNILARRRAETRNRENYNAAGRAELLYGKGSLDYRLTMADLRGDGVIRHSGGAKIY